MEALESGHPAGYAGDMADHAPACDDHPLLGHDDRGAEAQRQAHRRRCRGDPPRPPRGPAAPSGYVLVGPTSSWPVPVHRSAPGRQSAPVPLTRTRMVSSPESVASGRFIPAFSPERR
ncbi:hypothetical protein [Streptomyces sp. MK37H]|uniref:hypothetical protein n=1 Tax=Streptomyces sp. MK37H TaxID=2699117 RepID=UPI0027E44EEB|nr:hypothetical protein [Streptomyces sp. MK37H]